MKREDLTVTKQNNVDVIQYNLAAADVYDEKVRDKASALANIIEFQYDDKDGKRSITSFANAGITLDVFMRDSLNKKQVCCAMSGLLAMFEIGAQGIPVADIIREPEYIYIARDSLAVKCVVIPLKQNAIPLNEIPAFFKKIIIDMKFADEGSDDYVAKMITLLNAQEFSLDKFRKYIEAELLSMNVKYDKINGLPVPPKVSRLGVMNNMQPQGIPVPPQGTPVPQQGMPMPPQGMPVPQQGTPVPQQGMPMPPQGMPVPQQGMPVQPQGMPMPPQGMPVPPQGMPMPPQGMPVPQPQESQGIIPGSLIGQLGTKPVPHIVRKKTGEAINITKPEFIIGKSKNRADYTIENNPAISREHCIIVQRDGVNYIKDNNSTNHTYVNGVELEPNKEVLLKNKTVIQLGDEEFTFLLRRES